ncbi:phosphoenolpyruvate carboxylase [Mycolicibacterium agri]|uniref:Phosphoenolpyruvate carboxylase n=1 Tax=Mycolicibacterium agri TaxID=36811 RepID=A0A2A7MWV1_MYCAG|nr:phosphoenolpyruvate carboxylase [Mycolicibacterium agri]GFG54916.1 hypothetical protein MAGR_63570 [Mycolicibacterium agri]
MKRREIDRQHNEYGCSAGRTEGLLDRAKVAVVLVWRSVRRKDIVPAVEDQLLRLQPICSAQQMSSGITCGAPAVVVAWIHAVDGCDQIGLSPGGDVVETLCQLCLSTVQWAMKSYVDGKREMASRCGTDPVCSTCGRPTVYLRSIFAVRSIEPDGSGP